MHKSFFDPKNATSCINKVIKESVNKDNVIDVNTTSLTKSKVEFTIKSKGKKVKVSKADTALGYINTLYRIERKLTELKETEEYTPEQVVKYRCEHSIPVLDKGDVLVGVITEADLFSQYLEVQSTISNIEKD